MPHSANIWYKDYDRNAFDVTVQNRDDEDVISYSGLSTFQIPSTVTIEVRADYYVAFIFTYPNEEPADAADRIMASLGDSVPNVHFRLGKRTRKIIEVRFTNAAERVRLKDFSF